jgi:hypothetical protein
MAFNSHKDNLSAQKGVAFIAGLCLIYKNTAIGKTTSVKQVEVR